MQPGTLPNLADITNLFNMSKIFSLLLGIIALLTIIKVLQAISSNLTNKFPSRRLTILQVVTVATFMIYIMGSFLILYGIVSPPKELMIAMGGSAAVAIGLSLKDLVSSLVAGLILLFDRPFQVGDRVTFGETYGEIQSIGLRAVRLITLDDNLVTIPNSKFVTDVVASANAGALDMMVCIKFCISPQNDIAAVRRLIHEILVTSRYVFLKKPVAVVSEEKILGLKLVVELNAKAYVLDVKFEKEFQSDIVERVEEAFMQLEIKRP